MLVIASWKWISWNDPRKKVLLCPLPLKMFWFQNSCLPTKWFWKTHFISLSFSLTTCKGSKNIILLPRNMSLASCKELSNYKDDDVYPNRVYNSSFVSQTTTTTVFCVRFSFISFLILRTTVLASRLLWICTSDLALGKQSTSVGRTSIGVNHVRSLVSGIQISPWVKFSVKF